MDLFWQIFLANLLSGILNTLIFWGVGIAIGYYAYKRNKKLLKILKKLRINSV